MSGALMRQPQQEISCVTASAIAPQQAEALPVLDGTWSYSLVFGRSYNAALSLPSSNGPDVVLASIHESSSMGLSPQASSAPSLTSAVRGTLSSQALLPLFDATQPDPEHASLEDEAVAAAQNATFLATMHALMGSARVQLERLGAAGAGPAQSDLEVVFPRLPLLPALFGRHSSIASASGSLPDEYKAYIDRAVAAGSLSNMCSSDLESYMSGFSSFLARGGPAGLSDGGSHSGTGSSGGTTVSSGVSEVHHAALFAYLNGACVKSLMDRSVAALHQLQAEDANTALAVAAAVHECDAVASQATRRVSRHTSSCAEMQPVSCESPVFGGGDVIFGAAAAPPAVGGRDGLAVAAKDVAWFTGQRASSGVLVDVQAVHSLMTRKASETLTAIVRKLVPSFGAHVVPDAALVYSGGACEAVTQEGGSEDWASPNTAGLLTQKRKAEEQVFPEDVGRWAPSSPADRQVARQSQPSPNPAHIALTSAPTSVASATAVLPVATATATAVLPVAAITATSASCVASDSGNSSGAFSAKASSFTGHGAGDANDSAMIMVGPPAKVGVPQFHDLATSDRFLQSASGVAVVHATNGLPVSSPKGSGAIKAVEAGAVCDLEEAQQHPAAQRSNSWLTLAFARCFSV